jgi:hypothetical protein
VLFCAFRRLASIWRSVAIMKPPGREGRWPARRPRPTTALRSTEAARRRFCRTTQCYEEPCHGEFRQSFLGVGSLQYRPNAAAMLRLRPPSRPAQLLPRGSAPSSVLRGANSCFSKIERGLLPLFQLCGTKENRAKDVPQGMRGGGIEKGDDCPIVPRKLVLDEHAHFLHFQMFVG